MIRFNSDKDESPKQPDPNPELPLVVRPLLHPESPVSVHYRQRFSQKILESVGSDLKLPLVGKKFSNEKAHGFVESEKGRKIMGALDKAIQQNIARWAKKMHDTILRTAIGHYSVTINELRNNRVIEEKKLTEDELKLYHLTKKFDAKALIPPPNQYDNLSEAEKKLLFLVEKSERELLHTPAAQKNQDLKVKSRDKSKKFKV